MFDQSLKAFLGKEVTIKMTKVEITLKLQFRDKGSLQTLPSNSRIENLGDSELHF